MSGWWTMRLRKDCLVRTKKRRGVTASTVAVRRGDSTTSAISPKKSPAESLRISCPPLVTSTSPSTITKNSRPMSPSRASTLPLSTSMSSVTFASSTSSERERLLNRGARPSAVALSSCEKSCMPRTLQTRSAAAYRGQEATGGGSSVAVGGLPFVAELGHGLLLPVRYEHWVVAESPGSPGSRRNRPLQRPEAPGFVQVGRERDDLAHISSPAVRPAPSCELVEQPGDVLLVRRVRAREARRVDAGPPAEPVDFEP